MTERFRELGPKHELSFLPIQSLDAVIDAYRVGSKIGNDLPVLPMPWKAISLGGEMKLIATAEPFGLSIKRYYKAIHAEIVGECFKAIMEEVFQSGFPLLLPFAQYRDALLFDYIPITRFGDTDNFEAAKQLKELLGNISTPLKLADYLDELHTAKGVIYTDPFLDMSYELDKYIDKQKA